MTMSVKPIPDGFNTVTPYLLVKGVAGLMQFLEKAFDAETLSKMPGDDGSIMHAEMRVGDTRLMMGEATEKWAPRPGGFYVYLENCDASYQRALDAGGTSLREPTTEFYGDRSCGVEDPSGNQWWISTHVEDVSEEDMKRRHDEYVAAMAQTK